MWENHYTRMNIFVNNSNINVQSTLRLLVDTKHEKYVEKYACHFLINSECIIYMSTLNIYNI